MKFKIPFTYSKIDKLKKKSKAFVSSKPSKQSKKLQKLLDNSGIDLSAEEYNAIKKKNSIFSFILIYAFSFGIMFLFHVDKAVLFSFVIATLATFFVSFNQSNYPKVYDKKRIKSIEKNLIPALEDILIQLNAGIPLFNIMANVAASGYGELSIEFRKAVKMINAGMPQLKVLEELGTKNSSQYFQRTLWQLSNGMRSGSNVSSVIEESIKFLNQEQLLQIQNYGNKLNPLIMFYLLMTVILPALGITFMIILSSMLGLSHGIIIALFVALFIGVTVLQTLFLGMIKSIRPSLL